ncbi:MAG: hypothetical protein R2733_11765 [Acidimicrobiales bacterium]
MTRRTNTSRTTIRQAVNPTLRLLGCTCQQPHQRTVRTPHNTAGVHHVVIEHDDNCPVIARGNQTTWSVLGGQHR